MRALSLSLLLGASLTAPALASNVLLVILDDVGSDKVGAYAAERYGTTAPVYLPETPTLDGLAALGLRFTNVYASPVCSPTRAGMYTGRYAFEHDVGKTVNATSHALGEDETTLFEALADPAWTPTPYAVGLFGKWHLGTTSPGGTDWDIPGAYLDTPNPALHGVPTFKGELQGEPDDYWDWIEVEGPIPIAATVDVGVSRRSTTYAGLPAWTDAVDWIAGQTGPWLAVVSATSAHADNEDSPIEFEEDDLPDGLPCADRDGDGLCGSPEVYAQLVTYADDRIAELLGELAAADPALLEDVVLVVVGDNGSPDPVVEGPWLASGDRAEYGKNTGYESGIQVPLVMARGCDWLDAADGADDGRYADGTAACTGATTALRTPGLGVTAPVQTQDLFATVLALAGSTYPAPSASLSLSGCFTATARSASSCGSATLGSRRQYTETFRRAWSEDTGWATTGEAQAGVAVVRRGSYKLIAEINEARACLRYGFYDLAADPYETDNLNGRDTTLTTAQQKQLNQLESYLTTTLAPDWLPATSCGG